MAKTKLDDPYGDEVSDAETAELDKLMRSNEVPEPDDQPGDTTDDDDDAGDRDTGDDDAGRRDDDDADRGRRQEERQDDDDKGDKGEDDELAAFLEKHKDKSPEELARIALQQSKRANRAEFDTRKLSDNLNSVLERIQQARDAKLQAIEKKRTEFEKKVADDPDAALLESRREQLERDENEAVRQAEDDEFNARADAAVALASSAIPEFAKRAPAIRAFGQEMGFSPEEVAGIVDGRQIVTLYLASIAGNMIKAGLIDTAGKFLNLPEPVTDPSKADGQGRGGGGRRSGFGRTPARGAGGGKSLEDQAADVLAMSDADFDKLDPEKLDALLRELEQAE